MSVPVPPLTLGVEEEYQIINPETRNLHAYITEFLEEDKGGEEKLNLMPELMQSQVEVGSRICRNVKEVRAELMRLRGAVCKRAHKHGLEIAAASTHPFAKWSEQQITEGVRYKELIDDMQGIGRGLLIFGMHVHVGFGSSDEEKDLMIEIMNQARYFIPHLLALSASSPFWQGRNTGLKSYRSVVFEMLPRTGIPHSFKSWSEYKKYERTLAKVGSFGAKDTAAKIWWDIRPHPRFDTLEFRITDICTTIDEAVCLTALFQAIVAKLVKLRLSNMSWREFRNMYISENKWRAMRYGTDGKLIDFGREEEVPFNFLIEELLEIVDDVLDDLGSRKDVEYVRNILQHGTSAHRQVRVYNENGGDDNRKKALQAVVDSVVADTQRGLHLE
jgi:carboxylate-amine ligase